MAKKEKEQKDKKKKSSPPATQTYLPIAEIKSGVVVLKDGTLRSVLLTSSINFALKSEEEQNALISSYVGFLNSLDFPIQIVVQSRRLQIQPYLDKLFDIERQQQNELLRLQIADYRSFLKEIVDLGQIMTKRFYVVVGFVPLSSAKQGFWSQLGEVLRPSAAIRIKEERFLKRKEELDLRVRHVSSGLQSVGLQVQALDTQSLIELYYGTYNPDIAFVEPLQSIDKMRVEQSI